MNNNISQNNLSGNVHESRFINGFNDYSNNLSSTTTTVPSPNTINYNDANDFCSRNNDSSTMNNNISHPLHPPIMSDNNVYHYQQSMPNNASTSQYSQYIGQNPLQNAFPHFLNITINSPQTNIIIMPVPSSDMQNQPQQGHTYLNHSPSADSSQTQFQQ